MSEFTVSSPLTMSGLYVIKYSIRLLIIHNNVVYFTAFYTKSSMYNIKLYYI